MTRKLALLLPLVFLFPPFAAHAQNANEDLWAAARKGDAAAVKALLDKGADVNAKFRYGATALSYAADKGHIEVVKILIERGADVNVKDTFYNATPIVWAAIKGHADIVRALLDKGADGKDDALLIAADGGHIEVVKAVLGKGGVKAETLSAALAGAMKNNHTEIVEVLKKAGAVPPPKADFQVDAETLKTYAGLYKNPQGTEFTVVLKDGKLFATPPGQSPVTLGALDRVTFKPTEFEGITIVFNVEGGKVTGFTLKQGANNTAFKKVEQ